jgi:multicomponent Na+:H+ antiporter subunit G
MWQAIAEWIGAGLIVVGVLFMLLGAVAIVRMPDIFTRIQSASKASTLGAASVFLALAIHFGDLETTGRALVLIAFTAMTVPIAAHALGLAAHRTRLPLWPKTRVDEMRQHEENPPAPEAEHGGRTSGDSR